MFPISFRANDKALHGIQRAYLGKRFSHVASFSVFCCCGYVMLFKYRKIPILSPGLIFVQKAFLLGLFSGELIIGGANYWREFCVSKWFGLDNENSLNHQGKQPKTGKKS